MEEMKFKLPVKAYTFGMTWEIRDRENRKVVQFTPLSGDIQYKKKMVFITEWIAELINKNGVNVESIPKIVQEVKVVEQVNVIPEVIEEAKVETVVEQKKQRGRPRKQ